MTTSEILGETAYDVRAKYGIDVAAACEEAYAAYEAEYKAYGTEFDDAAIELCDMQLELGFSVFDYITGISSEFPDLEMWPETAVPAEVGSDTYNCLYYGGAVVALSDYNPAYAAVAKAYRPLLERTIVPRLREKLIREEPLLQLADNAILPEQTPDEAAVAAHKAALKRAAHIRWRENPDTARRESPAHREFIRRANHIDENPPLKPAVQGQDMSTELYDRLQKRGRFHQKLASDQYSGVLATACWDLSKSGDLTKVLLDNFGDKHQEGSSGIMDAIDTYAASLSSLERQRLCEKLAGIAEALACRRTDGRSRGSSLRSASHDRFADARDLLTQANGPDMGHGVLAEGKVEKRDKRTLFRHNGGELMLGRMMIPVIEGYNFGNPIDDGEDSDSVRLRDPSLDQTAIIPGFTSDAKLHNELIVSPADRDPYDISEISVASDRVAVLAHLYREGGLPELASHLESISRQSRIRLDTVVDLLQLTTIYDETIGWGAGAFDIAQLQSYGLVKDGAIVGNCSVSAGMLCEVLAVLGQTDIQRVGGIPLTAKTGTMPLHAQVIFKDAHGTAHVVDATGGQLLELQRKRSIERLMARLAVQEPGSNTEQQEISQEFTLDQHPSNKALTEALATAVDEILDAALLLARPQAMPTADRRDLRFAALARLPDQHATAALYRDLLNAPQVTVNQFLGTLNGLVDRYTQWIANDKQPYTDSMDALDRFRAEASQHQAAQALYSGDIANVYQLLNIVKSLRRRIVDTAIDQSSPE